MHKTLPLHTGPPNKSQNVLYTLKCIYFNSRSIVKHLIEIWDLLTITQPDLCFITETWLHQSALPSLPITFPQNYKSIRQDRELKPGGGIAVAFRNSLRVEILYSLLTNWVELITFKLHPPNGNPWNGAFIYHPLGQKKDFSSNLTEQLAPYLIATQDFLLIGDFNYRANVTTDPDVPILLTNLEMLNVQLIKTGPTHSAGHTLDLLFSTGRLSQIDTHCQ